MSTNTHLHDWLPGFPVREAPVFVRPACPSSCNLLSILLALYGSPEPLYTHFQEKRSVVTLRDDRSNTDLGCHLTAHQRNADVTLWYFFQGLLAQARLSSNQEFDQVNLCLDLITHSKHIMGGKPGKGYILWGTLAFRGFLVVAFSS